MNIAELTAAELAKLLAQARKAKKEKAQELASLPTFSFLLVMSDSSTVVWTGKADNEETAKEDAKAYAATKVSEVVTVFDMCKRPLPGPRGRKRKDSDDVPGMMPEPVNTDGATPV